MVFFGPLPKGNDSARGWSEDQLRIWLNGQGISTKSLVGPTNGDAAYIVGQTIYYTVDGTFSKATYPGLRAVWVRMVGGGGGAGSCQAAAGGACSIGGPGGGGEYSEGLILASALSASETVTRGDGGTAGGAAANDAGNGQTSSFGAHVTAVGGGAGDRGSSTAASGVGASTGEGGTGGTGDLTIRGGDGQIGMSVASNRILLPQAGGSAFGQPRPMIGTTTSGAGQTGFDYGTGGRPARAIASGPQAEGGAGAPGLVIVTLLY